MTDFKITIFKFLVMSPEKSALSLDESLRVHDVRYIKRVYNIYIYIWRVDKDMDYIVR